MKTQNQKKQYLYWGAGNFGKLCLKYYPDIKPICIIDQKAADTELCGIPIKRPQKIKFTSDMFVVITVKSEEMIREIEGFLVDQGLKKGENYCTYLEFFDVTKKNVGESLNDFEKKCFDKKDIILMVVPILDVRNRTAFQKFIYQYVKDRKNQGKEVLIISNIKVLSEKYASTLVGTEVFAHPEFDSKESGDVSGEDLEIIRNIESRKAKVTGEEQKRHINIFKYYENLFSMIRPQKVIMWGSWIVENYIIEALAKKNGIKYGYMEHGWLPGTYQVDPKGIMGQSEYAGTSEISVDENIRMDKYNVQEIKQFIASSQIDTRIFVETEEDENALSHIRRGQKTVFLVGMDDYGMQMNPNSWYWDRYISSNVKSSEDALEKLMSICKRNKWNLVYKPHPGNPISSWVEECEDVVLVRECSVDRLIRLADVVVSVESAVDFKTLIYEKPLVQLGLNAIVGKQCSYVVSDIEDLEPQIKLAMKQGHTEAQKHNFEDLVQILLQKYLWDDLTEREVHYGLLTGRDFVDG